MAKIKILSARAIENLPHVYHADGGNLFLRVRNDSKVWFFRYKSAGKQISIVSTGSSPVHIISFNVGGMSGGFFYKPQHTWFSIPRH